MEQKYKFPVGSHVITTHSAGVCPAQSRGVVIKATAMDGLGSDVRYCVDLYRQCIRWWFRESDLAKQPHFDNEEVIC